MLIRRPVRAGRPGLIGTAARTAVVAGTATAVSGNVARRQQERAVQRQHATAYEDAAQAQQAAPPTPAPVPADPAPGPPLPGPPTTTMDERISQLERLAVLRTQGILSDQEFETQKARILGS